MQKFVKLIILASVLLVHYLVAGGCGDNNWCVYQKDLEGTCTASGYTPGGGKVILEPIEAPIAELEENSIAQIAKIGGFATTVLGDQVNVLGLIDEFKGVAEKLSVGLGIWGTLLSFAQLGSPTPQDIIDACNKALAELTDEVNDQFTNMQAYVDQAVLDVQADMMNLDYQQYHTYFSNCINEVTADDVNMCMEEAERLSGSDYHKFMPFLSHVDDDDWKPIADDVKKMEVQLLAFRDYAQLRVMELLTLSGTYKDMDGDRARNQTKRFLTNLKDETGRYLKYAKFCYNHIYNTHNPNDNYIVEKEICGDIEEQYEGWNVHTRNWRDCETLFSPMLISTQVCESRTGVRMDGKCPTSECVKWKADPPQDSSGTIRQYAVHYMRPYFNDYRTAMTTSVENFWKPHLMNRLKTWQQIYDQVDEMLEQGGYNRMEEPPKQYLGDVQKKNIAAAREKLEKFKIEATAQRKKSRKGSKKTEL